MTMGKNIARILYLAIVLAGVGVPIGLSVAQIAPSVDRGRSLYQAYCASCHGLDGDGAGPAATGLTPPPTNFKNAATNNALTNNAIEQAILVGKAGTAMQGYGTVLQSYDVASLEMYLRSLATAP